MPTASLGQTTQVRYGAGPSCHFDKGVRNDFFHSRPSGWLCPWAVVTQRQCPCAAGLTDDAPTISRAMTSPTTRAGWTGRREIEQGANRWSSRAQSSISLAVIIVAMRRGEGGVSRNNARLWLEHEARGPARRTRPTGLPRRRNDIRGPSLWDSFFFLFFISSGPGHGHPGPAPARMAAAADAWPARGMPCLRGAGAGPLADKDRCTGWGVGEIAGGWAGGAGQHRRNNVLLRGSE